MFGLDVSLKARRDRERERREMERVFIGLSRWDGNVFRFLFAALEEVGDEVSDFGGLERGEQPGRHEGDRQFLAAHDLRFLYGELIAINSRIDFLGTAFTEDESQFCGAIFGGHLPGQVLRGYGLVWLEDMSEQPSSVDACLTVNRCEVWADSSPSPFHLMATGTACETGMEEKALAGNRISLTWQFVEHHFPIGRIHGRGLRL